MPDDDKINIDDFLKIFNGNKEEVKACIMRWYVRDRWTEAEVKQALKELEERS